MGEVGRVVRGWKVLPGVTSFLAINIMHIVHHGPSFPANHLFPLMTASVAMATTAPSSECWSHKDEKIPVN